MSTSSVIVKDVIHEGDLMRFTLENINLCYANALRRTILSEIDICVIKTENEAVNQCFIEVNTTRLHNEILKHRLSCIPIHISDLTLLPNKYVLELDVQNNSDKIMYVTTEAFKLKNKETNVYLKEEEVRKIFPPCSSTQGFIDFCRLRPKLSDNLPGEHIKLTAEFSIGNARENSMFNVVSKCSYMNTRDPEKQVNEWKTREKKLREQYQTITQEEVDFEKRNFELLDAERCFQPDSYDFVIQTIGIYDNIDIVVKACIVLQNKFVDLIQSLLDDSLIIRKSETTIDHCYDIILDGEDYTVGKILEYNIYQLFYVDAEQLSFCGFKKYHPHNTSSIVRIAFTDDVELDQIKYVIKEACDSAQKKITEIYGLLQSRYDGDEPSKPTK
jgi:DNA-directed RNA polymerase subunit L/DNA-directed RNA polymerase alpha subunit